MSEAHPAVAGGVSGGGDGPEDWWLLVARLEQLKEKVREALIEMAMEERSSDTELQARVAEIQKEAELLKGALSVIKSRGLLSEKDQQEESC